MKNIDIPVRGLGPNSQPADSDGAAMEFLQLPDDMMVYEAPVVPEPENVHNLEKALEMSHSLLSELKKYKKGQTIKPIELGKLNSKELDFINGLLGNGEVSIQCNGEINALIQESVLAGVWRIQYINEAQQVIRDTIEVTDIPGVVSLFTFANAQKNVNIENLQVLESVYNAPSLLSEISNKLPEYQPGNEPYIINLSLLPHTEEDIQFLSNHLGIGPIIILSRGYGNCRISSTATKNVWWVQYFNSQDTLILNTIELVDVPKVACASTDDIEDSTQRLKEILSIYQ